MRLILVGPPGSGKGTQAKLLSGRLGLSHIGTGDLLREAVRLETPAGRRARPFVLGGQLVPDDLVNDMVEELFTGKARPDRFVTDGYPRTASQARAFDGVLRRQSLALDVVLQLVVDDDEIVRRLGGRWVCPNNSCRASYHTTFRPPKVPGVCDECGTALVQREDDLEATVRKRLLIYHQNNLPLLAHYEALGLLRRIQGTGEIETIYNRIVQVLPSAGVKA
jgi:adenylate kinase